MLKSLASPLSLAFAVVVFLAGCTQKPKANGPTRMGGNGPGSPIGGERPEAGSPIKGGVKINLAGNSESLTDNFFTAYDTLNMTPAEKRGRAIWYQGTLGNGIFHTKVLQQRFGVYIDWYKVLNSAKRDQRFAIWGVINDPDCVPGDASSFGFDKCPGDDELLKRVGEIDYIDPACDLEKKIPGGNASFKQEDACKLQFGTSTGVVGLRKFPNPQFNEKLWLKRNGGRTYDKFTGERLQDASIEPPFLVGMSCAGCHVGFNPLHPPANPEHPKWDNISGTIGGQHLRMSEILGSGMPAGHLLVQALTNAQAGATDTSAVPHDETFNPGTINALFNLDIRVRDNSTVKKEVIRSFRGTDGKFGQRKVFKDLSTPNILKGGEDDVGPDIAVQRVYVNIGMCARECWVNHLPNIKAITGRNSSQTPFDIDQCRRDCGEWRALEDRVGDVLSFLVTRRADDLKDAVNKDGEKVGEAMIKKIEAEEVTFGGETMSKLELGRRSFAKNCAECHSSLKPTREGQKRNETFFLGIKDYRKTEAMKIMNGSVEARVEWVRTDWMGNDALTRVQELEVNQCRALHSNHMAGHVWDQFSSEDYKKRASVELSQGKGPDGEIRPSITVDGGRGYMRNISLISAWATAPFLHNNALGDTLCNRTPNLEAARAIEGGGELQGYEGCVENADAVSVEDRVRLYENSMKALLNPKDRGRKVLRTYKDVVINFGPKMNPSQFEVLHDISQLAGGLLNPGKDIAKLVKQRLELKIPKGTPVNYMASLNERAFINGQLQKVAGENMAERYTKLVQLFDALGKDANLLAEEMTKYSHCSDLEEDKGHNFGSQLSDVEKDALIQFVKTL
ncbi:MAG: hypothetical protein HYR96_06710 [Deltaproteobacteria bacterium]|nr:hypothetical protein [Deltaproteobacteria bacterium]MBI3296447.1 hypothetical protein [Deltaproteobacteria bacterium]